MNPDLVAKSLCYHGQPLQKIWDGERGSHDLYKIGLSSPDFSVYLNRQKNLSFQDRAKRLKLHQFIARKAPVLFDSCLIDELHSGIKRKDKNFATGLKVTMPPYEAFISKNIDKSRYAQHVLNTIQPGDIVFGTVLTRSQNGLLIKVLCTGEPVVRYLADLTIKAIVLAQNMIPAHDKKGNPKPYITNDYVCCEVLDISVDADRMTLGMKGAITIDAKAPLGAISSDQFPEYYKSLISNPGKSYEELLESCKELENPNCVDNLFQDLGLDSDLVYSNMSSLKNRFPSQEYASELRQVQASKWAFRSVADGIEHFKVGRHSEAFQCLNKALNIDPRNVEGLVARGALYANSGSFKKAVEDFETALKLNPYHANARKYMGETLVALGRSYEEENRIDEARKAYTDCLNIIPHHEEAKSSLEFLNGKSGQSKNFIDLPDLKLPSSSTSKESPTISKKRDDKKKKSSKRKKQKTKKHGGSSSSSSSDSSRSSDTSSTSTESSSSESSNSSSGSELKHKKKSRKMKQKSLSPLSKRLALMDEQHPASGTTRYQFNQPFHLASQSVPPTSFSINTNPADDYEAKVRNFLEMTRDEDDYESKVRKLVEEASKHRRERKEEKSKKKNKKKEKKSRKESKKKEKKKDKNKEKEIDNIELKEALKIFKSLPILDIGSKLSADLEKYEKSIEMLQRKRDMPSTSKVDIIEESRPRKSPEKPIGRKLESPLKRSPSKEKPKSPLPLAFKPFPVKPPVVLDKFGCFRLAAPEEGKIIPLRRSPSSSRHRYSRSRSRSRHFRRSRSSRRSRSPRRSRSLRRSRSRRSSSRRKSRTPRSRSRRTRSRSLRRSRSLQRYSRRSRSHSIRRRERSRSRSVTNRSLSPIGRRSRSFSGDNHRRVRSRSRSRRSRTISRSRSRSPMSWRRGRRNFGTYRGSRGFGYRGRGGRGRGRGGFRGGGRRSPFGRERESSCDESPRSNRRDEDENKVVTKRRHSRSGTDIEGKWTHDKYEKSASRNRESMEKQEENWDDEESQHKLEKNISDPVGNNKSPLQEKKQDNGEPSIEEIDKIINQAQKERKEEILQRDKNLLKKSTPNNLPF